MISEEQENGPKRLVHKAMKEFEGEISGDYKSQFEELKNWRNKKHVYNDISVGGRRDGGVFGASSIGLKNHSFKALGERGARTADWVIALHEALLLEFEKLQSMHVKLFPSYLSSVALLLMQNADFYCIYRRKRTVKSKSG